MPSSVETMPSRCKTTATSATPTNNNINNDNSSSNSYSLPNPTLQRTAAFPGSRKLKEQPRTDSRKSRVPPRKISGSIFCCWSFFASCQLKNCAQFRLPTSTHLNNFLHYTGYIKPAILNLLYKTCDMKPMVLNISYYTDNIKPTILNILKLKYGIFGYLKKAALPWLWVGKERRNRPRASLRIR